MLAPDPGPGGLVAALTYSLLGPPNLVASDVLLLEAGVIGAISDVIRFNPAGIGGNAAYPASLVCYSDTADAASEAATQADTGFPVALYANTQVVREVVLPDGTHQATYMPGVNAPGFAVSYIFISSTAVPEPGILMLGCVAAVFGAGLAARRRLRG